MANYTTTFDKQIEFDGDKVVAKLKRMKRKHVAMLGDYMEKGKEGDVQITFQESLEMMDAAEPVLKDCLISLAPLEIDGEPFNVEKHLEDVLEGTTFIELISGLISALMEESFLSSGEQKKSPGNQDDTSKESQEEQKEA